MFRFAKAVATLIILSGCMTAEPDAVRDVHTQTFVGRSQEVVATRNATSVIYAQAFAGTGSGKPLYGINIRRNAGFSKWAYFMEAWSFGTRMEYRLGQSSVGACAPFGCDIVERGQIILTQAQFSNALQNGLELRLVGTGDTAVIRVPSSVFKQAMAQAPK